MQELEPQSLPVHPVAPDERRRWPRHKIDFRVTVTVQSANAATTVHGWAHDLSRGGLAAFLPIGLAVGKMIEMEIVLPGPGQRLRVRGTVRARRGFNYGIEFKGAEPKMWPPQKLGRGPLRSGDRQTTKHVS